MKPIIPEVFLISAILASALCAEIAFSTVPSLIDLGGGQYRVEFGVSETTDVEVSIIDTAADSIVRHLAAGVLGSNPPLPLQAATLHQVLDWDGKNDLGQSVAAPATDLDVRVRAGMAAEFDTLAGDDPYGLPTPTLMSTEFKGLFAAPDGQVYAFSTPTQSGGASVRAYDADGNYLRTVFPPPASLPLSSLGGLGVNLTGNGGFVPKMISASLCGFSAFSVFQPGHYNGLVGTLMQVREDNTLVFLHDVENLNSLTLGTDGSRTGDAMEFPLITSPALPAVKRLAGRHFMCLSPDKNNYYLSGVWESTLDNGTVSVDTGFWRDGRVYKVDKATGAATVLISLDSVAYSASDRSRAFNAVHGLSCDDSGHILICDRTHGRIGVYDTAGVFLGGIPVSFPELAHADPVTGAVYALTLQGTGASGAIRLLKLNGWRGSPTPVCSALITTSLTQGRPAFLTLARGIAGLRIWTGYLQTGVRIYNDDGASFSLFKDFRAQSGNFMFGYERPAVDRKTETFFVNNGWDVIGKISDWERPAVTPCTLSNNKRLYGQEVTISFDRQLYVQGPGACGDSILRYSLDPYPAPINWPNTGYHCLTPGNWSRMGANYGFKGFAVAPDKQVASLVIDWGVGTWWTHLADSGRTAYYQAPGCGRFPIDISDTFIDVKAPSYGCAKYDLHGNFYTGFPNRSRNHVRPAGFETDAAYSGSVGSVYKFAPGAPKAVVTGGCCNPLNDAEANVTNCEYVYKQGLGMFGGLGALGGGGCVCRSPRFDVDLWGRLFIPNTVTSRINVVDNNDNPITAFGEYGNYDSKGPGSLVPTADVPLCFPMGVAVSDNFAYVTDFGNVRVVRVKLAYALENVHLPEAAAAGVGAATRAAPTLAAAPNPFNPTVTIILNGGRMTGANVKVYDLTGRFIAELPQGQNNQRFVWNAAGRPSGVYVVQARNGDLSLTKRIILSR